MDTVFSTFHWTNLLIIPGLLVGYTVHELAHAFTAYFLGDYSQVERGRISLNPLRHLSWIGSFAFIVFGIGWPRPLRVSPHYFKHGPLDMFLVAVAGPIASFCMMIAGLLVTMALASLLIYAGRLTPNEVFLFLTGFNNPPETLNVQALTMALTSYLVSAGFWLTFTSLLPLPGQDGFVAVTSLIMLFREGKRQEVPARPRPMVANTPWTLLSQHQRRNNAADLHFKIGAEYHESNQYDDAIARYRQAVRSDRNFGPAYVNMGLAYLGLGRRKEAIQAFRGAVEYADDKKSQAEAWQQLHYLSEVNPLDREAAQVSMARLGAAPWTDTKPQPNWLMLGISSGLVLVSVVFLYSYLLVELL